MSMLIQSSSCADRRILSSPLARLLLVGSLLGVSVLLSKIASGLNAPMLTYLALTMGISGLFRL